MDLREPNCEVVRTSRAWYGATISEFLDTHPDLVFAQLASNHEFTLLSTQKHAWLQQIEFLRTSLAGLAGSIYLEFNIPRMGRRIDAVLLIGSIVFVVEFKVGEATFDRAAVDQVWDYALDLKNFHAASHQCLSRSTSARNRCPRIAAGSVTSRRRQRISSDSRPPSGISRRD